jgi:hypothetical protein
VLDESVAGVAGQVGDVVGRARQKIIDADNAMPPAKEMVA